MGFCFSSHFEFTCPKTKPLRCGLALFLVAGCGQSDPDVQADGGGGTGVLAPPPAELCQLELACDEPIPDDPKVDCELMVRIGATPAYDGRAAVEKRGRSSLNFPKPNYAIELRDQDGKTNRPMDFFGFGPDEDWILDGSWADRSFLRNALASDVFQSFAAADYGPQSAFCTLSLNGDAQGIYRLVERIKQGEARVDLHKDDGQGASFVIRQDEEGALRWDIGLEGRWNTAYPKEPSRAQLDAIQGWLDEVDQALSRRSDAADGVFTLLDRANVIDWLLIQELTKNIDAYKLSLHLSKDVGGLGRFIPWDFDLSLGQPVVVEGSRDLQTAHEVSGWIVERTGFVWDLVSVPGFGPALARRWRELRLGPLSQTTLQKQIDAYRAVIAPVVVDNFEIWPLDEIRFEQIYGPYHLYEVTSHADEVSHVKAWLDERLEWIDDHIDEYVDP